MGLNGIAGGVSNPESLLSLFSTQLYNYFHAATYELAGIWPESVVLLSHRNNSLNAILSQTHGNKSCFLVKRQCTGKSILVPHSTIFADFQTSKRGVSAAGESFSRESAAQEGIPLGVCCFGSKIVAVKSGKSVTKDYKISRPAT
jgi:hypothetical protein